MRLNTNYNYNKSLKSIKIFFKTPYFELLALD